MINRALREVFSNFVRISFEGLWRGIYKFDESVFNKYEKENVKFLNQAE